MNTLARFAAAALTGLGLACAGNVKADYHDTVSGARISVSPDPVPVNQESAATLFILTRADVQGFNGLNAPVHVPEHQIVGQRLDLYFPTTCAFVCQNLPITRVSHPFRLPPLSEGMHTVRILADSGPEVLAEFTLPVGGSPGGSPAPVSLPVGGGLAMGLLGMLLIGMVWMRIGERTFRQGKAIRPNHF